MIVVIACLVLVLLTGSVLARSISTKGKGIPVSTVEVSRESIKVQIVASGVLEEVTRKEIFTQSPQLVRKIEVQEGDWVEKDQLLATLEGDEYTIELAKAKVNLEQARLELKRFRDYGMAEAERAFNNSKQAFAHAERSLNNAEMLFEEGAISQNELDLERIRFEETRETYEKTKNAFETSSLELKNLENNVALYELSVIEAEKKVEKMGPEIRSPIAGVITLVNAKEGVLTNPSQPAFVVSDLSSLRINVNISEYDISNVRIGQDVEITTDAVVGRTFKGNVKAIAPVARVSQIGQSTETAVEVTIDVTEKDTGLKPGFSAKSRIIADSKDNCLVIPFDAIVTENNGAKVVYIVENNTARKREIETGIESDFTVEVTKGLNEGDRVILTPPPDLKDGMKVQTGQK
ncbi:MAG: hypothetical protein HPY66_0949 [Firmicutes bacterium]|nr:hypothetical protein [Bacillota bacterium]MDI6707029.1 efflux RND transporter periplasmic adaptor subunit [Bacillota bacterium]